MSMKNGFGIITGKVIDMVSSNITKRDGGELKKLEVLVKPSAESAPIQLEAWAETASNFEMAELILQHVIIKCDISSREWKRDDGSVKYFMSLRIREWETLSADGLVEEAKAQFDATF